MEGIAGLKLTVSTNAESTKARRDGQNYDTVSFEASVEDVMIGGLGSTSAYKDWTLRTQLAGGHSATTTASTPPISLHSRLSISSSANYFPGSFEHDKKPEIVAHQCPKRSVVDGCMTLSGTSDGAPGGLRKDTPKIWHAARLTSAALIKNRFTLLISKTEWHPNNLMIYEIYPGRYLVPSGTLRRLNTLNFGIATKLLLITDGISEPTNPRSATM
ncbi:hypothetical protein SISNIDRAFT_467599 [Sistotremastrum niveocremeum HHB9708]|uniref:Uncharacterized protein n=1 Tax=Sistotremastrum niveocremeum HHB9708 TaxID=1314777 RepID=A0A164SNY7_9AGAM|nr:hypothetical protein SISNIDRAFT_467599 [Sistotremastrum niveocremeum HHB9708]